MFTLFIIFLATFDLGMSVKKSAELPELRVIVESFGYNLQTHFVLTSDGYNLTVHRLLLGKDVPTEKPHMKPLLMVEGVLQSSASKLAKGDGLAYSLVKHGYDVWLSNYRGNLFSRHHTTLSIDQPEFWNFTLHEMGTKDLPAVIDYILDTTHRNKLLYNGFSMGTTLFWIMASSLPEYQEKIAAMVAIAPVAVPKHAMFVKEHLTRNWLKSYLTSMIANNNFEVLPYKPSTASNMDLLCSNFPTLCKGSIEVWNHIHGSGIASVDALRLINFSPAGISARVIIHYIQMIEAEKFQRYDYGEDENWMRYNLNKPPEYNLKEIALPVYLMYSKMDEIATPEDIKWLTDKLPHQPDTIIIENFRHSDFSLSEDLDTEVIQPLMQLFDRLATSHTASLSAVLEVDLQQ